MFGRSFFRDDPFFSSNSGIMDEFEQMDRMMSSIHQSFGMSSMMALPPGVGSDHRRSQQQPRNLQRNPHQTMIPFGSGGIFGRNAFRDMENMMQSMSNNPNAGQFYSSSKVISYSSNGTGRKPKYYEATSETTHGPDGVRQTKKSERDSETGVNRMAVGHHIHDRGHVVERIQNTRTNEREEKQDFINLDEDDKDSFHQEWHQKSRTNRRVPRGERSYQQRNEPRAINSAEYHRQNLERSRARHQRQDEYRRDTLGQRHVRLDNRPEEI